MFSMGPERREERIYVVGRGLYRSEKTEERANCLPAARSQDAHSLHSMSLVEGG
jgi:hypothetical protein